MMDTVATEITFSNDPLCFIVKNVTVRATIYAELTSSAGLLMNHHLAILPFRQGIHRAKMGTNRPIAMETEGWNEVHMELLTYPSRPDGHDLTPFGFSLEVEAVFLPASNLTGMTANAVIQIDQQYFLRIHFILSLGLYRADI